MTKIFYIYIKNVSVYLLQYVMFCYIINPFNAGTAFIRIKTVPALK